MIQCSLDLLTFSVLDAKAKHENDTQHETNLSVANCILQCLNRNHIFVRHFVDGK